MSADVSSCLHSFILLSRFLPFSYKLKPCRIVLMCGFFRASLCLKLELKVNQNESSYQAILLLDICCKVPGLFLDRASPSDNCHGCNELFLSDCKGLEVSQRTGLGFHLARLLFSIMLQLGCFELHKILQCQNGLLQL